MRVENLLSNYTNNQNKPDFYKNKFTKSNSKNNLAGIICDAVCFSNEEIKPNFDWLNTYIHLLSDEMVLEKIRNLFCLKPYTKESFDDILAEKILFEIL
jgi:hypothetical protein